MSDTELERLIRLRPLPAEAVIVEASVDECAALARRFDLAEIESLKAAIELENQGKAIRATGELHAEISQICAISAEPFPVSIRENVDLRFVPEGTLSAVESEDDEIELEAHDCDEIEYSGDAFDLGEAIAQTLGLAIDPYAEGPNADAIRESAAITQEGEEEGPLAEMLKGLKSD